MNGVTKVLQRINNIEQRFTTSKQIMGGNFNSILAGTISNQADVGLAQGESNMASANEIVKMIQLSSAKYGVNPQLALAVAKAESDLSPNVVSSAGAVGVMQLMPETARGLGIRNIHDPRENIDGGVAYLKQLLTTFNGDVTKAVAAYNAGPQAVKDYNGIPPYPETKAYVAKVLNLYNN